MSRHGKIARLARSVREELNRRLDDGEAHTALVEWLNSLPETRAMLARDFGGKAISEQNMSDWKAHGFREWEVRREVFALAAEMGESGDGINTARLAQDLLAVVAARYAGLMVYWDGKLTPEFKTDAQNLRGLTRDFALIWKSVREDMEAGSEKAETGPKEGAVKVNQGK